MRSSDPYRTPAAAPSATASATGLGDYLDGTQPLWKAFWLFHFLGFNLLWLALVLLARSALFVDTIIALRRATGLGSETIMRALFVAPILAFALLSLLVVWRCAANTGLQLWAWLARLVVSLYLLWAASKVPPLFL